MDARSLFICNICNDYLSEPMSLPCHCTVCKHHLNQDTIECKFCNETFNLPHDGIRENKRIKLIIDSDGHLSEDEKKFRQNIQKSLSSLEQLYTEYNTKEFEFENFHSKHFQKIESAIHERCAQLKTKLDEIANDMIARMNSIKDVYHEQKSSNRLFGSEEFQKVLEKYKNPNLNYKRAEQVQLELKENIETLSNKITEIDTWKIQLDGQNLTECDFNFLEQSFGSLYIPGSLMQGEHSPPASNSEIKIESKSESENPTTTGDSDFSSNIDESFVLASEDEKEIEQSNHINYSIESTHHTLSNSSGKKVPFEYFPSHNEMGMSESKNGSMPHNFGVLSQKNLEMNREYSIDSFIPKLSRVEIPNYMAKVPTPFVQQSYSNIDYEENRDDSMFRSNGQNRRARINYTNDQIQVLEETFKNQKYPQPELIDHLSKKLQLCNSRISIWFQNRRAKDKHKQK